jgi:hypothetical protein
MSVDMTGIFEDLLDTTSPNLNFDLAIGNVAFQTLIQLKAQRIKQAGVLNDKLLRTNCLRQRCENFLSSLKPIDGATQTMVFKKTAELEYSIFDP